MFQRWSRPAFVCLGRTSASGRHVGALALGPKGKGEGVKQVKTWWALPVSVGFHEIQLVSSMIQSQSQILLKKQ